MVSEEFFNVGRPCVLEGLIIAGILYFMILIAQERLPIEQDQSEPTANVYFERVGEQQIVDNRSTVIDQLCELTRRTALTGLLSP